MIDPQIDSVDVSAYSVPMDAPEADGTISWDSTTMILVQVRAGDTVGTGWTYGPAACATVITEELVGVVRGRDALDVGAAFDAMVKAVRNAGRAGIAGYAISAVDVALWDLKARLLDQPLHRLLGAVRGVPVRMLSSAANGADHSSDLVGWGSSGVLVASASARRPPFSSGT